MPTISAGNIHLSKPRGLSEIAAQTLVGLPILVLPWIYGGVQSSVQVWLLAFLTAAWVCALVGVRNQDETIWLPVAVVPLLVAIGLGAVQMAPLSAGALKTLAPANSARWNNQLGASESAGGEARPSNDELSGRTISLFPASTRRDLALLIGAVAVYLAGAQFFCRPEACLLMLGAAAVNGAAISFTGIAFLLRPASDAHLAGAASPFATFINRNHAAGFLNLALAGAIGMAIWSFTRTLEGSRSEQEPRSANRRRGPAMIGELAVFGRTVLAGFTGWQLLSLLLVALISAGILCSMSRGAWVAAGCAALGTTIALEIGRKTDRRHWILLVAAAMAVALVFWIGRAELIPGRLSTLWTQVESPDGRIAHWKDGLSAAREFWPMGSGLGTYRNAYLLHETTSNAIWFYHAENQYLEALVEAGWLGLVLMLSLIGLAGWACRRLLREPAGSLSYACGAAGAFALMTQVVHSFFDFGLYIPANMALFALMMGSVCGLAAQLEAKSLLRNRERFANWRSTALVLPVSKTSAAIGASLVAVAVCLAGVETSRAAIVESAVREAKQPMLARQPASAEQLGEAIAGLEKAVTTRPDDAEAQLSLAKLRIVAYRTKLFAHRRQAMPESNTEVLWQGTAPAALHAWVSTLAREGRQFELESLQRSAATEADLAPAARHLLLARQSCPIVAETHLLLAEVAPFVSGQGRSLSDVKSFDEEEGHLARMRNVTQDGRLLMESGFIELQSGRIERAVRDWKLAMGQSREQLPFILEASIQHEKLASHVESLLPEDPVYLVELAKSRFGKAEHQGVRRILLNHAHRFLEKCKGPAQRHYARGMILALQDEPEEATRQLGRAVDLCPEQTDWRYELALTLQKSGDIAAAHEQAGLCVVQNPNDPRYEQLLRQLVRLQLTTHGTPR